MPELPEVETIVLGLRKHLVGEIVDQSLCAPVRVFQACDFDAERLLPGKKVQNITRRCKYLFFELSGFHMVIHLGMTGQLILELSDGSDSLDSSPPDPHIHFSLRFKSGKVLNYRDTRKFGKIFFFREKENLISCFAALGLEPLSAGFTFEKFSQLLEGRKGRIKPFLLDQSRVCGIGNIYADEALFLAGIHPESRISSLDGESIRRLYSAIPEVLRQGIKSGGTTFRDYRNSEGKQGGFQEKLSVYGREGLPCPNCGDLIHRIQVGGRSSHFCPVCQEKQAE